VILTGRDAKPELIELADLVTEMKEIKHPYHAGIMAQQGIDY
jgi:cob(I)alamin adenosyltransferase